MRNFKIVRIDSDYCDYLRKFDAKVMYNKSSKKLRPFIGVLFKIDKWKYFAPLSSPKPKHKLMRNTMDFFKIKSGELGAINFNNMIPVIENNYKEIDLYAIPVDKEERKYQKMLKEQLAWLNANKNQISNRSYKLYQKYKENKLSENIRNRCCNYPLLEIKSIEFNKIHN